MSRNPSRKFDKSTGHGRGAQRPRSGFGCLIVTAADGVDAATMTEELLDAAADEGLEYGVRVAALGRVGGSRGGYGSYYGGGGSPLVVYKVYPDGREQLVRGVEIARIDLKAFKRMLALGDTPYVRNQVAWSGASTVAAPAMLFEELDVAKIDRDFDKPPILPSPLARPAPDRFEE
jgi:hypothetical protein